MSGKVAIFFLLLVHHLCSTSLSCDVLSLWKHETLASPGDVFELGFFNPGMHPIWYLGIWLKQDPDRTALWVANRNQPLIGSHGTLRVSNSNLVLFDRDNYHVWSTSINGTVSPHVVVKILDNGNLVVKEDTSDTNQFLWQSFDFPTDSIISEMNLRTGTGNILQSWRNSYDPMSGEFLLGVTYSILGFGIYLGQKDSADKHLVDLWNEFGFGDMPPIFQVKGDTSSRQQSLVMTTNHGNISRLRLGPEGIYEVYTWFSEHREWKLSWSVNDSCFSSSHCGSYSFCSKYTARRCNCIEGFTQKLDNRLTGCARVTKMSCNQDKFTTLPNMKLPNDSDAYERWSSDLQDCEENCLINCQCTAYTFVESRKGQGKCVTWSGELEDMRNYTSGGHDLHVRIAPTDHGVEDKRTKNRNIIIGFSIGVSILLLVSFIIFRFWKRKQKQSIAIPKPIVTSQASIMNEVVISSERNILGDMKTEDLELPLMDFEAIAIATNNFSNTNKLGKGGFGIVYKGRLIGGKEVAVKRLSKMSLQGTDEFENEVGLIARLQHINLVQLLGCCVDKGENMLIYEYLENLSLDSHLFDKSRRAKLNWPLRFDIAKGIARGLLYLHQDSRYRIIHRDLKVSNVLLGKNMIPKISDFGLARIFGRDKTYGYMSPEYAMNGIFSVKSDIFSYGILLLEIISGKRSTGFYKSCGDLSLHGWVWRNWKEGKRLDIIDPIIIDSTSSSSTFKVDETLRCIHIGLLCVQDRAEDRPEMSSVMVMLGRETTTLPEPKQPELCVGRGPLEPELSKQGDDDWTVNQITRSVIDAR